MVYSGTCHSRIGMLLQISIQFRDSLFIYHRIIIQTHRIRVTLFQHKPEPCIKSTGSPKILCILQQCHLIAILPYFSRILSGLPSVEALSTPIVSSKIKSFTTIFSTANYLQISWYICYNVLYLREIQATTMQAFGYPGLLTNKLAFKTHNRL